MADPADFQKSIGISFKDPSRLVTALTHSSFVNESPDRAVEDNERLEFLGDAVLGQVVAEKLYRDHPGLSEGEMTRLRSMLVCRETLGRVAEALRLGDYLYLGRGEEANGGRGNAANLSGAMEAVIAAVLLDQGAEAARSFVLRLLEDELGGVLSQGAGVDYKSRLQELMQSRRQSAPAYRLAGETGPDHDKTFTVEVMAGDAVLGRGSGRSKKAAEMEAARSALEGLDKD